MKIKILALLQKKFAGMRKDALTQLAASMALTIATDEDAEKAVENLTDEQVTEYQNSFRSEIDREVAAGVKTNEENLRKKYDFKDKANPNPGEPNPGNPNPDDVPAWAKALIDSNNELKNQVNTLQSGDISKARAARITEILKDTPETIRNSKIADFNRMAFEDDNAFNEYAEATAAFAKDVTENLTDRSLETQRPIFGKVDPQTGVSNDVQKYLEEQKPESSDALGGKK